MEIKNCEDHLKWKNNFWERRPREISHAPLTHKRVHRDYESDLEDIGEKESAKANAEAELKDEQAYLAQVKKSCDDTAALFAMRKKDRAGKLIRSHRRFCHC